MSADAISRLWQRLRMLVGRSRVTTVNDSGVIQVLQVQLLEDETKDGMLRVAEYGLVSNPPTGTDAVCLFLAGERTLGVVIGTNNQTFRMRGLASGEVAIHDNQGRSVLLGAGGITIQGASSPIAVATTGDVNVTAGGNVTLTAGTSITLTAPTVTVTGDLAVSGALTNAGHNVGVGHEHTQGTYHAGGTPITGISGTVST